MLRKRRGHSSWVLIKLTVVAAALWGGYVYYQNNVVFSPSKILEKSTLKVRNFETKVEEIATHRNNIKAYLFEDKTNPIISISFIFKNAGLASDDDNKIGISNMAAALLDYGAGDLDARAYREALEDDAIVIDFDVDKDDFTGSLLTTKANSHKAFALLKKVLTAPRFDKNDIEQVRAQILMRLKQQKERPEKLLGLAFAKELYSQHPYERNSLGDKEAIEKISREQLQDFIQAHLSQANLIIGAAGDISADELSEMIDEVFGGLPKAGSINFVRQAEIDFAARKKNVPLDIAQSISSFAALGVDRNHPDFYPLYVANYIFGGSGLNSRLNILAREKQGLTYGISTYLSLADKSSLIVGGFSATPENFAKVTEIVQNEWQNFGENGISAKELADAKDYLTSSYNLRFASINDIALMMAYMQRDNLGLDFLQKRNDYVRAVTLDDVNSVIKKYFNKNKLVFVNIGKFE